MNFSPIRCISSHLTSRVALCRNLQGREENWVNDRNIVFNRVSYLGKVVTAEVGSILLCMTSTIEACAYLLFVGLSLIFVPCTWRPLNHCFKLLSSASFTAYWNLGNALVFNLCYSNLHTHESFARHSLEHSERGSLLACVIKTLYVALFCLAIFMRIQPPQPITNLPRDFTRPEDAVFIYDTLHGRTYRNQLSRGQVNDLERRAGRLVNYAIDVGNTIRDGTKFFKDHILTPISAASKQMVIDCDPEIYSFVMTRAIYLYTHGRFRNAPIPKYFKLQTQSAIADVRAQTPANAKNDLEEVMLDHAKFDQTQNVALNRLKGIASKEMQGGIFATSCWQGAVRDS